MNWSPWAFLLLFCGLAAGQPYVSIVAPRAIRPNSEYHVAVTIHNISEPHTTLVEVSGQLDHGGNFTESKLIVVQPNFTGILNFTIDDVGPGTYELRAQAFNGSFETSTKLKYVHKSYSVFTQTDRAVYKPGDKIRFRSVVLDSRLKPNVNRQLDVYITDGKGNRVKEWNNQNLDNGIYSGELELSQSPVLGNWTINANINNQTYKTGIQVDEYVLPEFKVTITSPPLATYDGKIISVTVNAKYTYGKPVKGTATVEVSRTVPYISVEKSYVSIEGTATYEFDIVEDLRIKNHDEDLRLKIEASVKDYFTGKTESGSSEIIIHVYKYKMNLLRTVYCYKSGLNNTAFLQVTHHDGSPVIDSTNPVHITYNGGSSNMTKKLDENGMIELQNIEWPITAQYLNLRKNFYQGKKMGHYIHTFIQAKLRTERPTVGDYVEIEVSSTHPLKYLNYQILGRGDMLNANTIQVSDRRSTTFQFRATDAMAPVAHVLVHYIDENGQVIADTLKVEINDNIQNMVDITTTTDQVDHGEYVNLTIIGKPNSSVSLLGVDQRSLLLRSGNDISYDQVHRELISYDIHDIEYDDEFYTESFFKLAGAVILTNGQVSRFDDFPLAKSFSQTSPSEERELKVRKDFPETWIWETVKIGNEGRTVISKKVPDSITTWDLSGFSIHPTYGLGLMKTPRMLKVFKNFFISINLPYSVICNEIVEVPVIVSNYMDKNLSVLVTVEVKNKGDFEFIEISNIFSETSSSKLNRTEKLFIPANSVESVSFLIKPKKIKNIVIKATAISEIAGDSIEHPLRVKAEGETQYRNKAVYIDLRNRNSTNANVAVDIPELFVQDSDHVEISAVGDILGPSIKNLDRLIKMPRGCGEQNMLNFVPNIVILDYLNITQELSSTIKTKALQYLEIGYQQELTYKRKDGSFSAFGEDDSSGSTWLTAFVAKSFKKANKYIAVEEKVILEALEWIANRQKSDGSFEEVGTVFDKTLQGGASNGLALTAYVVSAFTEIDGINGTFREVIKKGVKYIEKKIVGVENKYVLSICTYVLHLAHSNSKTKAFRRLKQYANWNSEEELLWWSEHGLDEERSNSRFSASRRVDVEMTSYALLVYLHRNELTNATYIMKWLVRQRNAEGGFTSTQDTVVGLYALSKIAESLKTHKNNNMHVEITTDQDETKEFNVNSENHLTLQKHELHRGTRSVNITATGTGFALIQVASRYNLNVTKDSSHFHLDSYVTEYNNGLITLSIKYYFIPKNNVRKSNMAVMEVNFPSGYKVDQNTLKKPPSYSSPIKRIETNIDKTVLTVYFDYITNDWYQKIEVKANRIYKVANNKPVAISLYDYYDPSRQATTFYEIDSKFDEVFEELQRVQRYREYIYNQYYTSTQKPVAESTSNNDNLSKTTDNRKSTHEPHKETTQKSVTISTSNNDDLSNTTDKAEMETLTSSTSENGLQSNVSITTTTKTGGSSSSTITGCIMLILACFAYLINLQ